jgi:hypothetical protein
MMNVSPADRGTSHCQGCTIEQLRREWRRGAACLVILQVSVNAALFYDLRNDIPKSPTRWVQLGSDVKPAPKKLHPTLHPKGVSNEKTTPLDIQAIKPSPTPSVLPLDEWLRKRPEVQGEVHGDRERASQELVPPAPRTRAQPVNQGVGEGSS